MSAIGLVSDVEVFIADSVDVKNYARNLVVDFCLLLEPDDWAKKIP